MVKALYAYVHAVGHWRVARLIREEGLHGKAKGRFTPRATDSRHSRPVAENQLDREFAVDSSAPAWVEDCDRGSQYASSDFGKMLATHGFVPSMSRKGNYRDSAVIERFFAMLKNEEAAGTHDTKAQAYAVIASYIPASTVPLACILRSATSRSTTMPRS